MGDLYVMIYSTCI